MRKEKLKPTSKKYIGSWDITINNYMPVKWTAWRNGQIPRNVQPPKTEPERNRKLWADQLPVMKLNQ